MAACIGSEGEELLLPISPDSDVEIIVIRPSTPNISSLNSASSDQKKANRRSWGKANPKMMG